ncbi:MAG: carbohydrate ABC transporter permease [Oscillospiraceae bacterium]|nr:carbohydrate ABC transporter permease [Oscillospiraceae bacterium]
MLKRRTVGDVIADIIIYLFLATAAIATVIPFVYVIAASFASEHEILTRPLFIIPREPTLEAYIRIFGREYGMTVLRSLGSSIFITLVGTITNLFFTTTMAYALAKPIKGRNVILNCVLFTMVFSGGMIPLFIVVKSLGMYNSYAALILPGAISAYNMIIVKNFFQQLPAGLEEAASIDGCSDLGIFWKIALPLSLPMLATFGLFYAVGHWNNYFGALLYLEDAKKYPFQLVLRNLVMLEQTAQDPDDLVPQETLKMAMIVVGTVPILCVYPFLQKHFAAGVMVGAIKG